MWNSPTDYYKHIKFYTISWYGSDTPKYTATIHSLKKKKQYKNREVSKADFVLGVEMFGKEMFAYLTFIIERKIRCWRTQVFTKKKLEVHIFAAN